LALLAGALALAGCGGEAVQVQQGSSATSSDSPSPVPAPAGTADASPGAVTGQGEPAPTGTAPIEQSPAPTASGVLLAAVVKDIRFADHGSFDRVVVEYQGTFGGWRVAYQDRITEDPSDRPVPLKGAAFLSVVVRNATFDNQVQAGGSVPHVSYDGPRRIEADLPNVKEIADAGDFESVLSLGIGLDHSAGIRAYRLASPSRLVIDIAH
jgi:hypothetical protein